MLSHQGEELFERIKKTGICGLVRESESLGVRFENAFTTWGSEAGGSLSLSPAWSKESVPGHLEMHRGFLSGNTKTNKQI